METSTTEVEGHLPSWCGKRIGCPHIPNLMAVQIALEQCIHKPHQIDDISAPIHD